MVGLNAEDRGKLWRVIEKVVSLLATFGDKERPFASPAGAVVLNHLAADRGAGSQTALAQDGGKYGCRRRFSMSTRDGDAGSLPHQLAQELTVGELRNAKLMCSRSFRIGFRDCRAENQEVRFWRYMRSGMAQMESQLPAAAVQRGFRLGLIRSGERPSQVRKQLGQRPHASSANADQMGFARLIELDRERWH